MMPLARQKRRRPLRSCGSRPWWKGAVGFACASWGVFAPVAVADAPGADGTDPRPRVRDLVIECLDVVDPAAGYDDSLPFRLANRLHYRTRSHVVARELLVGPGDLWDESLVGESAINLRRLPFIADATIDTVGVGLGLVDLQVRTQDSWTTKPVLAWGFDGDRASWAFGLQEANLLGRGLSLAVLTSYRDRVRNTQVHVLDRRLGGSRVRLQAWAGDTDYGERWGGGLALPFATRDSEWCWGLGGQHHRGRLDREIAAELSMSQIRERESLLAYWGRALGRRGGPKLRYGASLSTDRLAFGEALFGGAIVPEGDRRERGALLGFVGCHWMEHVQVSDVMTSGRVEDIPVGASGWIAAGPDWGSAVSRGYYAAQFTLGWTFHESYFGVSGQVDHVAEETLGWAEVRSFSSRFPAQTWGLRVLHVATTDPRDGVVLHTGGSNGPRGIPSHWESGRWLTSATLEDWVRLPWRPFAVRLGLSAFVDAARAGGMRDGFAAAGYPESWLLSVGAGLRLDVERSLSPESIRLEYAIPLRGPGRGLPTIGLRVTPLYFGERFVSPRVRRVDDRWP